MKELEPRLFVVCGLALALGGGPVVGQEPLADEFQVNERTELTQDNPHVAVAADGSFTIGWRDGRGETSPYTSFAVAKFYDPEGQPIAGGQDLSAGGISDSPWVLTSPLGGYQVTWGEIQDAEPAELFFQNFDLAGQPSGPLASRPLVDPNGMAFFTPALTSQARFAVFWIATRYDLGALGAEVKVARLGRRGQLLGEVTSVALDPEIPLYVGDIGVDGSGNAVVTWTGECEVTPGERCDVFAQRLSPSGERLSGLIRANTRRRGLQEGAKVAVAPDGSFLVVWDSVPLFPEPSPVDLFGQFFSPTGGRVGREIRVNTTLPDFQWQQDLAADPKGNYIVVWSSFRREDGFYGWDILGQLFRHDGSRVGKEFRINQRNTFNEFPQPQVAFGGNGTFVVAWNANDGDADGVFARRFAASPGDELCLLRGADLLCDLGRSGGEPEIPLASYTGQLLFGDADLDGQEEPCVFTAGRFDCDTDRRGEPFEARLRFGREGEVPLFGDVDGDGRQEPCVRRGRFHLCDTGHNGGLPESGFGVGQPGDAPLLGDLDGDGRDDACVFVPPGRFLCDLRHDGREDFRLDFGRPDDSPLLMDFDADGKDDPCVFRAGHLLCDTAHDGGEPEVDLALGETGDRLLAGNLDGL